MFPHRRRTIRRKRRYGSIFGTGAIVIILLSLFCFSVYHFRTSHEEEDKVLVDSIADILTPDSVSLHAISEGIDTESREAEIYLLSTSESLGVAKRGEKDDYSYCHIKTDLPEIDRETFFYEGWLVRKIPYDYFSMGEMITNEEGEFVLEWEGREEEDYQNYTQVIITLEPRDGNRDPGEHIAEGEFGE